jgi:hypothetical protein
MKYLKYLTSKKFIFLAPLISVAFYLIIHYLVSKQLKFNLKDTIVIFNYMVFLMLYFVAHDLSKYDVIKKKLTLNRKELINLLKYSLYVVIILSLLTTRMNMIFNLIIIAYLVLMIKDFYMHKFSFIFRALFLGFINLMMVFAVYDKFEIITIVNNSYLLIYVLVILLIPLVISTIIFIKDINHKFEVVINREKIFGNKDSNTTIKLNINKTTDFYDLINDLINKKFFPTLFDDNAVWTIMYNDQDLISYNVDTNHIFIYYLNSNDNLYKLINNGNNEFNIKFYQPSLKRARELFNKLDQNVDYKEEYLTYKVKEEQERLWSQK